MGAGKEAGKVRAHKQFRSNEDTSLPSESSQCPRGGVSTSISTMKQNLVSKIKEGKSVSGFQGQMGGRRI